MTEKELFPPVRDLFVKRGYKVNAEVRDCDVTATKDDEFIIIELKKNLSVTLLAQGLKRLKTGADVYIAVPKPKKYSLKKFRSTFAVIKKLETRTYIRFRFAAVIHLRKSYLSRPNSNLTTRDYRKRS